VAAAAVDREKAAAGLRAAVVVALAAVDSEVVARATVERAVAAMGEAAAAMVAAETEAVEMATAVAEMEAGRRVGEEVEP
jgi:hypothetical protein